MKRKKTVREEVFIADPSGKARLTAVKIAAPREPAQVYSVRIPAALLAQLRDKADRAGTTPSALMRTWIVAKLETGTGAGSGVRAYRRTPATAAGTKKTVAKKSAAARKRNAVQGGQRAATRKASRARI